MFLATARSIATADPSRIAQSPVTIFWGLGRPAGLTILDDALIIADPQHQGDLVGFGRVLVVPRP